MRAFLRSAPLIVMAAVFAHQAAFAAPPPWAPAHGYRAQAAHRYVYYPNHQIYYAPDRQLWFWIDGGDWRVGSRLPSAYQSFAVGGVSIELDAAKPYERHGYVVEHYGKPGKGKPRKVDHHKHR